MSGLLSSTPPPPPSSNITYVKVACHCGLNEFRAGFPTDALPISNDLCHCSACRHSSGQMAVYHVNIVSLLCADTDEPFHVDGSDGQCISNGDGDLIPYKTSENGTRYFCSACSAQLIFHSVGKLTEGGKREGAYWCVAAGALERTEGIVQPGYHIYIEDTLDGGLADHLRSIGHLKLPRYRLETGSEVLPLGWKAPHDQTKKQPEGHDIDSLHFACHCKTLRFKITRPNAQSTLPHAAFPDLLYPYDITHLAKLRNSGDVKWWLRPLNSSEQPTKYFAGHCACTYCRLTSGFEIQSWVYVPRGNILDMDGQPLTLQEVKEDELSEVQEAMKKLGVARPGASSESRTDAAAPLGTRMPGLKQYISSPGRYRESCQKCGATAFAWQAGRPDLICVAVALVDETQDGARAESWLDWCLTRVGFTEQAVSPMTVEGLTAGLRATKEEKELGKSVDDTTTIVITPDSSAPVDAIAEKDRTSVVFTLVEEVVKA
ncbi:hypothetical protein EST38_g3674 [Candolleomyces aberdarensis]|uniref:CENP-V/GFA domain-containing protein n=1 Tax=Candolleomyces aberdarensis TaxID=2316362 RepID=A0A4Q2DTG6_9AGAR|nr:hypothetical protein EST38_g3674 [Candolleomyces aberdarensis]